jgi:hypothetical protein
MGFLCGAPHKHKESNMIKRSAFVKAAAAAGIALAALGTASVAQARSDVFFSIGANIAPGVAVGVSNAPYYRPAPVYYQPAPVYYQPAPVYYEPAPVYYQPAVYVAPPVVTYVRPYRYGYRHGRHWR